ncbi:AAA family ATPase [Candidatus Enterococcus leclercqii]|uniref:AAA family ATPase n=1 Tax=Candidatus Enterococcus leclercqii TaxID=1857218 RepID=UPI00137A1729|nr:MoxR family ATPase [Enterococcus sp. CU9D]KAF1291804.1 AAA family ATPase [Enterococcus sp. CU9D]
MREEQFQQLQRLTNEIEKVVIGKREVIQMTLTAMLAGGHVLFEDIPGVGKTVLVKTLAKAIQGQFSRVQFTPDLQPSDISGVSIYNEQSGQFEFRPGPIFTTILLADEINRTAPRTQAALLEAMSEGHVTIDNHTYALDQNFFVLATQNPIEYEGTFALPEAQLDRFLFRLAIGYPVLEDELLLMNGQQERALADVRPVLTTTELSQLKQAVDDVYTDELVTRYALDLVRASRVFPGVRLGVSPRGGIAFMKGARAYAMIQGRDYVTPEDLQKILPAVFSHRLILQGGSVSQAQTAEVLRGIIQQVAVPVKKRK